MNDSMPRSAQLTFLLLLVLAIVGGVVAAMALPRRDVYTAMEWLLGYALLVLAIRSAATHWISRRGQRSAH